MQPNQAPSDDFLASLGIQIETPIDETVLTSGTAENVRFRSVQVPGSSKTYGYVFNEVDKFIREIVTPSLKWYQKALHKRDVDVYTLAGLVDTKIGELNTLSKEYEKLQYNYQLQQGLASNQNDKEVLELIGQIQTLQAENDALRNGGAVVATSAIPGDTGNKDVAKLEEEKAALEEHITALEIYIDQIKVAYEELEAKVNQSGDSDLPAPDTALENLIPADQYNELLSNFNILSAQYTEDVNVLQEQLATAQANVSEGAPSADTSELEAHITALEEHISGLNEQYEALSTQYTEDVTALQLQISQLQPAEANGGADPEEVSRLQAEKEGLEQHIEAITAQYEALSTQYTEDVTALQLQVSNITTSNNDAETIAALTQHISDLETYASNVAEQYQALQEEHALSANYAEIGQLKVQLAASEAEIIRLSALLEEQEDDKVEDVDTPRLPLLTEKRTEPSELELTPEFKNLPPGIRPDDL